MPSRNISAASLSRRLALTLMLATASMAAFANGASAEPRSLKVGIMSGEEEDIWRVVAAEAAKHDLQVETVVFNDYTQPNEALENGEVDANAFQHQPYLDNQIKAHGYRIVPVGYTGVWPIGLYSRKAEDIAGLKEGAVIGIPNDPSNEGRALKLLEGEGLIKLKPGTGILATLVDVAENPRDLDIRELDAGVVGRSIDDLDAAVVNTDWALKSGLSAEDRIAQEPVADNPYRNFIAVKADQKDEPWVKALVDSYQNPTVKAEFERVYRGTGLSAY